MKILFICTHNRCRSILGEAITNHYGQGKVTAVSAGSTPSGEVHPLSIQYLNEHGISTDGLKSQSWDEFEHDDIDVVITVCDSAANEQCPVWFGNAVKVHWGLSDPSRIASLIESTEEEIKTAFYSLIDLLKERVQRLVTINEQNLNDDALKTALLALHTVPQEEGL